METSVATATCQKQSSFFLKKRPTVVVEEGQTLPVVGQKKDLKCAGGLPGRLLGALVHCCLTEDDFNLMPEQLLKCLHPAGVDF